MKKNGKPGSPTRDQSGGSAGQLARRLAECLDMLTVEILKDVHAHAFAGKEESGAISETMWDEVRKTSVFPQSVTGELWVAALGVAASDETTFGWLCRAAATARQNGMQWTEFLLTALKLKDEIENADFAVLN